ncbi:MAG: SsrA-binding protein SmpB [Coriobacteriales bacterium]|jgi:SsrA-binding protein|nr:SsrA-binding protein SmpB [Coriobacteriales bacterium]
MAKKPDGHKTIAKNRKAFFDYHIEETFEAGIELTGTEVRSLREGGGQLTDSFALIRAGELWLSGLHIKPYSHGNRANVEPDRRRRLLMHKRQIRYLGEKIKQAGLTLTPLALYFNDSGRVKVELGLARGKKNYDKRATLAARDTRREIDRALKNRTRNA